MAPTLTAVLTASDVASAERARLRLATLTGATGLIEAPDARGVASASRRLAKSVGRPRRLADTGLSATRDPRGTP
jgi:hypothetical protein